MYNFSFILIFHALYDFYTFFLFYYQIDLHFCFVLFYYQIDLHFFCVLFYYQIGLHQFFFNYQIVLHLFIKVPCFTIESFYTWDSIRGINIDLLFLAIDLVFFGAVLILIESGILKRVRFASILKIIQQFNYEII